MRIFRGISQYDGMPCVLTMGKFDGVHAGHAALLHHAAALGRALRAPSVALTFDRHPAALIDPQAVPRALTTEGEKWDLIEKTGIDDLIVCAFTKEFSHVTANDFLQGLCCALHPVAIVCGDGFTFGRDARGDARFLVERAIALGYRAVILPPVRMEGEKVSSTKIRSLLDQGAEEKAFRMLGREPRAGAPGEK